MRAFPIEAHDFDQEYALDLFTEIRRRVELIGEGGVFAGVEDLGVAEDFEAFTVGVVHQEERDAVGAVEVARAEKLAVSFGVGEAELVRAEDF